MSGRSLRYLAALPGILLFAAACGTGEPEPEADTSPVQAPPPAEGALAWDSDEGITISVIEFVSERSSTTVTFRVDGRDDLGPNVHVGEPMRDQHGAFVMQRTGSAAGRDVTLVYNGVPAEAGTITALIRIVQFLGAATPQTVAAQNLPVQPLIIKGRWELAIPFDGTQVPAVPVEVEQGPAPFGPGELELTSATIESGFLIVQGRIGGFTMEQVPALTLQAVLVAPDGTERNIHSMGFGGGNDRSGLEIRFAAPPAGEYRVRLTLGEPSHPFEPTPVAELKPHVGATAERSITVP